MTLARILVASLLLLPACVHDFGFFSPPQLVTICHQWKGEDGYRHWSTNMYATGMAKRHLKKDPWDYKGECHEP